jgi:hypothetical protein
MSQEVPEADDSLRVMPSLWQIHVRKQKTRLTRATVSEAPTKLMIAKSFILDHLPTMDFCKFPELKKLHGCMA